MTLHEALKGTLATKSIIDNLELINVRHLGFDGNVHEGQLVIHKDLAIEVKHIFSKLLGLKFPIQKVTPIVQYNWDDHDSIRDNNTSAFNYRTIFGKKHLSNHSYGRAIDINPHINPYITEDGRVRPEGPAYDPQAKGAIVDGGMVVNTFLKAGWEWGGHWKETYGYVDYQHFQKIR